MAFPLLPLLAVAAVAAIAAASKGDSSGEGGTGDGGGLPGPEPTQAQVIPMANLARDVPIWEASGWQDRVAELSVSLSNAHDVAVIVANEVFPMLSLPPVATAPSVNKELWRVIRNDVWGAMNPGVPFPVD
jgi:hypothetical protein